MKYCIHCGAEQQDRAHICPSCGKPSGIPIPDIKKIKAINKLKSIKIKKEWMLIAGGIIGALVLVFVVTSLFNKPSHGAETANELIEKWAEAYAEQDAEAFLECFPEEFVEKECDEENISRRQFTKYIEDRISSSRRADFWEITDVNRLDQIELNNINDDLVYYDLEAEEARVYVVWFSDDDEWVTVVRIDDRWFVTSY